jgi:hypothetical protein
MGEHMRTVILGGLPLLLVLTTPALAGKKKKKGADEVPVVGWERSDEDRWSCYNPPKWEEMGPGDRKLARGKALDAMYGQWTGERRDGVKFEEKMVIDLETVLLGRPDRIEEVANRNVTECVAARASGATISWGQWLDALPAQLTEGECPHPPFDYTLYDYLDIGRDWQIKGLLCAGDSIAVKGSETDFYRISEKGPWINVAGDPDATVIEEFPCTRGDCLAGQLIMRFKGASGVEQVIPVGRATTFKAPEDGEIHVMINDVSWYDNAFKVETGVQHHTSIEYSPVSK